MVEMQILRKFLDNAYDENYEAYFVNVILQTLSSHRQHDNSVSA